MVIYCFDVGLLVGSWALRSEVCWPDLTSDPHGCVADYTLHRYVSCITYLSAYTYLKCAIFAWNSLFYIYTCRLNEVIPVVKTFISVRLVLHWLGHVLFAWHRVWLLGSCSIQSWIRSEIWCWARMKWMQAMRVQAPPSLTASRSKDRMVIPKCLVFTG